MAQITRTVTVFDQNTQEKTVLENVTVNTFGELKTVLRQKGINLEGMDVREGISRVDLRSDAALLPHDTPYRGGTTNDLMILLTKTNKKVSSGLGRSEAVQYIKDNNLQDAVKDAYGKNWTNVSTPDLVDFVNSRMESKACKPGKPCDAPKEEKKCNTKAALSRLVEILYEEDLIDDDEACEVKRLLNKDEATSTKGFSQDEIWDALREME